MFDTESQYAELRQQLREQAIDYNELQDRFGTILNRYVDLWEAVERVVESCPESWHPSLELLRQEYERANLETL